MRKCEYTCCVTEALQETIDPPLARPPLVLYTTVQAYDDMDATKQARFQTCYPEIVTMVTKSKDYETRMYAAYAILVSYLSRIEAC